LKDSINPNEEKLRMNFEYWLDLASRKIQKNKYFDGNLIIILESAHFITEGEKSLENNMRFWLPKNLPPRIKVIITMKN